MPKPDFKAAEIDIWIEEVQDELRFGRVTVQTAYERLLELAHFIKEKL